MEICVYLEGGLTGVFLKIMEVKTGPFDDMSRICLLAKIMLQYQVKKDNLINY